MKKKHDPKVIANWRLDDDFFRTRSLSKLKAETHNVGGKGERTRKSDPYVSGEGFYQKIEDCKVLTKEDGEESERLMADVKAARKILDTAKDRRQVFLGKAFKRARPLTVEEAIARGVGHDGGSIPGLSI